MSKPTFTPPLRQITVRAVLLSIVLAMVLAAANAYLGLFAGLTVSASIPAAVLSMAVLKWLGNSNPLENNIVQTSASAGEALAAGAIFTLPALIIMGYWQDFPYRWVLSLIGFGGLLGVILTIPLRRSLLNQPELPFPEGHATAAVLQSGHNSAGQLPPLLWGALLGAFAKLAETGLRAWSSVWQGSIDIAHASFAWSWHLSPALAAVGFIVRLRVAIVMLLGGILAWWVAIPLYIHFFSGQDSMVQAQLANGVDNIKIATDVWASKIRYIGVGAMLVGGLWTLLQLRRPLWQGLSQRDRQANDQQQDLPRGLLIALLFISLLGLWVLFRLWLGDRLLAWPVTAWAGLCALLFAAVAAYMAGLVGSSHNPVSGVTIATVLLSSLLILLIWGSDHGRTAGLAILVGAAVCCAAAIAGDNIQDLKAGQLLGATPWKQQVAQLIGVISAALVVAPVLDLLLNNYGFGAPTPDQPHALAAPQATLMAAIAEGVFGGDLPWDMISIGVVLGLGVAVLDGVLVKMGSHWRLPVLAVAVGLYLPFNLSFAIFIGGLIEGLVSRHHQRRQLQATLSVSRIRATLFAAGLITGEALLGVLLAVPIAISGQPDLLNLFNAFWGPAPGVIVLLVAIGSLVYWAKPDTHLSELPR